jgi:hypothetical protein
MHRRLIRGSQMRPEKLLPRLRRVWVGSPFQPRTLMGTLHDTSKFNTLLEVSELWHSSHAIFWHSEFCAIF